MKRHPLQLAAFGAVALSLGFLGWVEAQAVSAPVPGGPFVSAPRATPTTGVTPIGALPITINACGSFILTDCLTGVAGANGITIDADDVTIDLNGYTLLGVPGSQDGITVAGGARSNITVKNGVVRGWGAYGVDLDGVEGSELADLRVSHNGIDGLRAGPGASVESSTASNNGGVGIQVRGGTSVFACVASENGGDGIRGADGCTIKQCTTSDNDGDGIEVFNDCQVVCNTCYRNDLSGSGRGIHVLGNDSRIDSNHCTDNSKGIEIDGRGNISLRNTASGNPAGNYDFGFTSNPHGPVVNVSAVSDISTIPAASHPWTNFEF